MMIADPWALEGSFPKICFQSTLSHFYGIYWKAHHHHTSTIHQYLLFFLAEN